MSVLRRVAGRTLFNARKRKSAWTCCCTRATVFFLFSVFVKRIRVSAAITRIIILLCPRWCFHRTRAVQQYAPQNATARETVLNRAVFLRSISRKVSRVTRFACRTFFPENNKIHDYRDPRSPPPPPPNRTATPYPAGGIRLLSYLGESPGRSAYQPNAECHCSNVSVHSGHFLRTFMRYARDRFVFAIVLARH